MRAGLAPAPGVVSCGDPGPLPKAGAAPEAEIWAAGWEGAGVFAAVGTDGLAMAGGTTAATGLGCADVVVEVAPTPRPAAVAGPAGRAVRRGPGPRPRMRRMMRSGPMRAGPMPPVEASIAWSGLRG